MVKGLEPQGEGGFLPLQGGGQGQAQEEEKAKCPHFGFATWDAQAGAGGRLFFGAPTAAKAAVYLSPRTAQLPDGRHRLRVLQGGEVPGVLAR